MTAALSGVPRTALFTLRARADEQRRRKPRFEDPWAVEWLAALGWPPELDRFYSGWIQGKNAARAAQIDEITQDVVARFEVEAVVELGCGLSSRRQRLQDSFHGAWVDVDLPEIIEARRELGVEGPRHRHVAVSALDDAWLEGLPERTLVIAEGLLYYLPEAEVRQALRRWRDRLRGGLCVFDVIGELDLQAAQGYSARIDAPVLWAPPPPFEAAMAELGLDVVVGLEPERLLQDALQHVDPWLRPLLAGFSKLTYLKDRRSGLMAGRLRPPEGAPR